MAEKNKAIKQMDDYIQEHIRPVLEKHTSAIDNLQNDLTELADQLEEFLTEAKDLDNWVNKSYVRDLRHVANIRGRIVADEMGVIKSRINDERTYDAYGMFDTVEKAHKDLASALKKRKDLNVLHKELDRAIKAGVSGKDSYKNLISLGVDMEEYQGADAQLPSTLKVSVDPKIINNQSEVL